MGSIDWLVFFFLIFIDYSTDVIYFQNVGIHEHQALVVHDLPHHKKYVSYIAYWSCRSWLQIGRGSFLPIPVSGQNTVHDRRLFDFCKHSLTLTVSAQAIFRWARPIVSPRFWMQLHRVGDGTVICMRVSETRIRSSAADTVARIPSQIEYLGLFARTSLALWVTPVCWYVEKFVGSAASQFSTRLGRWRLSRECKTTNE